MEEEQHDQLEIVENEAETTTENTAELPVAQTEGSGLPAAQTEPETVPEDVSSHDIVSSHSPSNNDTFFEDGLISVVIGTSYAPT